MSASSPKRTHFPKHCWHKASNRGVVRLDGKDHYTGPWGSTESDAEYLRLIAEWLADHRVISAANAHSCGQAVGSKSLTISELILAYWQHVQKYYRRPDGSPSGEEVNYRYALRPVRQLYGETLVSEFSPLKLKAVRQHMISAGLARTVINGRIGRIVRMFRWGVAEELVPETVHRSLAAVENLQKGRSEAREPGPVNPVLDEHVEATLPFLSPPIRAMVELQRVTALRSSEVCNLRGAELDMSGDVWIYRPTRHKTLHHGKARVVFIGPRGQELLKSRLTANPESYLFTPQEAIDARRKQQRATRKSKVQPSQLKRRKSQPKRKPEVCYTYRSFGCAIRRACKRAGVPFWHPHQLRHTRGTEVRKEYSLEGAQVALGHTSAKITEVYAERDHALARRIASETG